MGKIRAERCITDRFFQWILQFVKRRQTKDERQEVFVYLSLTAEPVNSVKVWCLCLFYVTTSTRTILTGCSAFLNTCSNYRQNERLAPNGHKQNDSTPFRPAANPLWAAVIVDGWLNRRSAFLLCTANRLFLIKDSERPLKYLENKTKAEQKCSWWISKPSRLPGAGPLALRCVGFLEGWFGGRWGAIRWGTQRCRAAGGPAGGVTFGAAGLKWTRHSGRVRPRDWCRLEMRWRTFYQLRSWVITVKARQYRQKYYFIQQFSLVLEYD